MTIKSDLWIRRMAAEQDFITPFQSELVRETEGRRIISSGASSYGYDMRLADDGFRVFSPLHGREIDPKRFDESSLVEPPRYTADDGSQYYLLPPQSYGLGVSVETFNMPRNVTGVCLGKCLTRDARVVDATTGDYLSLAEFSSDGSILAHSAGKIEAHTALAAISQGVKPTFTLVTRLGYKITATANHPFLTVAGWRNLDTLKVGSRIAAARSIPLFGRKKLSAWEAVLLGLMIAEGQCHTPGGSPTFTSADPVLATMLKKVAAEGLGCVTTYNGQYDYRLVNHRGRGGIPEKNKATQWLASYGLNVGALDKFVPSVVFCAKKRSVALFLSALFSGDGSIYLQTRRGSQTYVCVEYCSSSERLARDVQHLLLRFGIVSRLREKRTSHAPTYILQILRSADTRKFLDEIGFLPGSAKDRKAREIMRPLLATQHNGRRLMFDTIPPEFWAQMKLEAQSLNTSLYCAGIHVRNGRDVTYRDLARLIARHPESRLARFLDTDIIWDEIVSLEPSGEQEVFDLCVPAAQNFLANNLIVHNSTYARSGLMVNTTPLEAGWRGRLVIEIANLANLPLRVYINEGIGQVLFFESDEDCAVSYKDRGGKYQGQTGLTYSKL